MTKMTKRTFHVTANEVFGCKSICLFIRRFFGSHVELIFWFVRASSVFNANLVYRAEGAYSSLRLLASDVDRSFKRMVILAHVKHVRVAVCI